MHRTHMHNTTTPSPIERKSYAEGDFPIHCNLDDSEITLEDAEKSLALAEEMNDPELRVALAANSRSKKDYSRTAESAARDIYGPMLRAHLNVYLQR